MADKSDEFHKVGGNTDPKANPPSNEGPDAVHNPVEINRGNKPGQVAQEAGTTEKPEPRTNSGKPG
ncbi:hypothetical protein N825_12000 [Skermanella stibiiresistens SB22]|uniref:Uncharacterized protein n=1 Tax=Skermanella stibiiresistens SB22 TaxID=1385369 RepID=W9H128_9PROT|nr:hypothetical protein [Skermanella stibiiresistens]EWY38526.1 hypothetical protein N825_12000 [Skermanella stibiiresistens SB22]